MTKCSFFLANIFQEPFLSLYALLAFVLTKELKATAFEIAILTMLRPTVSLFSFYWGSFLLRHRTLLRANLFVATFLSVFMFLFSPLVSNVWYFIVAGAFFWLFSKAALPALLELLKINSAKGQRE